MIETPFSRWQETCLKNSSLVIPVHAHTSAYVAALICLPQLPGRDDFSHKAGSHLLPRSIILDFVNTFPLYCFCGHVRLFRLEYECEHDILVHEMCARRYVRWLGLNNLSNKELHTTEIELYSIASVGRQTQLAND